MNNASMSVPTTPPDARLRRVALGVWVIVGVVVGAIVGVVVLGVVGLFVVAVLGGGVLGALGAVTVGRFVDSALGTAIGGVSATEITPDDSPRLFNLLQGLSATAGVAVPRVSMVDSAGINVLVAADPSHEQAAELVVTRGFVEQLQRIEMEGAVATCLARLRSGLAEAQTLAVALCVVKPWWIPSVARRGVIADATIGQAIFDADVKGVGITRYPPGLAGAFDRMLAMSTKVDGCDMSTSPLWLADPAGEGASSPKDASESTSGSRVGERSEERPPLAERLALLREI